MGAELGQADAGRSIAAERLIKSVLKLSALVMRALAQLLNRSIQLSETSTAPAPISERRGARPLRAGVCITSIFNMHKHD